ncbi:hypothetical protein TIFTF001_012765 [Ficus carica]|uniref:TFIIB-type domain-containing protein n=1 Tax=Ficus carica TaxID=3494 RepID=A0AA87ZZL9_FICCA|nr:hypothetical protein TIFTF001_012765 [Ficus carica]
MSSSNSCTQCKSKSLVRDDVTGHLVCETCGLLQEFDSFEAHFGGISGPQGTFVRVGTSGTGTLFNYKEKKVYEAQKFIDDIVYKLGLSGSKSNDVKSMVATITDGEYGQGHWFTIFVGACAYVVMRKDNKSLPMAEVSSVIGSDEFELGRMVYRVVEFQNLKRTEDYPEFDIISSFERWLRNSRSFAGVGEDEKERMRKQGIFLIQCMVKWSLTTGRRPLPVIVAVLVFVGELNQVKVKIEDIAKEVHAKVYTSKARYRELLNALVKVAQALPWGKDVTVKNIMKNAPFVIQYMEKKSMSNPGGKEKRDLESLRLDLEDMVSECLTKGFDNGTDLVCREDYSRYFKVDFDEKSALVSGGDMENFMLSPECLSMVYAKVSSEVGNGIFANEGNEVYSREICDFDFRVCTEWWTGESELSKKLLLKQILEKDVGLEALPPSFVAGCKVYEKRREKISAAKQRIDRIMLPLIAGSDDNRSISCVDDLQPRKKRKGAKVDVISWEDLIIETLLLHQVKEEEIEKGHYNTLMDLYVFNSGIVPKITG